MLSLAFKLLKSLSLVNIKSFFIALMVVFLGIVEGISDGLGIGLLTSFLTTLLQSPQEQLLTFQKLFYFLPDVFMHSTESIAVVIVLLFFLRLMVLFLASSLRCIFPQSLAVLIRSKLVENTLNCSLLELERIRVGSIANYLLIDTAKASVYIFSLIDLVYFSCIVLTYLVLMASVNNEILISAVLCSFPFMLLIVYVLKKVANYSKALIGVRNEIASNFTEKFHNIRFIKAMGTESLEYMNMRQGFDQYKRIEIKRYLMSYLGTSLPEFMLFLVMTLLIGVIIYNQGEYKEYIVLYVLPLTFMGARCFGYIKRLNHVLLQVKQLQVSAETIYQFWSKKQTRGNIKFFERETDKIILQNPVNLVVFKNVSFGYDQTPVIKNFDLTLEMGHPVILRGKSGTGKTTIANLLRMLVLPDNGNIIINQIQSIDFDVNELRKKIGYATQDAILLYGSIRENLIYGLTDEISDIEIDNVLKKVKAYEFVYKLPEALNTVISEKGNNLSGGQKQRLALARILLKKTEILILDEVTNGLDQQNKSEILKVINEITHNIVCLIITHDTDFQLSHAKEVVLEYEKENKDA